MREREPLPPFGWADILFRLTGPEIEQRALASGALEPVATRLGQLIEALTIDTSRAPLTFAEFVADPGRALAGRDMLEVWSAPPTGDDQPGAAPVPYLDLALFAGLLLDRTAPRRTTGADLYALISQLGPPLPLAASSPSEAPDQALTFGQLLRKWSRRPLDGSWIAASRRARMESQGRITGRTDQSLPEQGTPAGERDEVARKSTSENVGKLLARTYSMFKTDTGWWLSRPNLFLDDLSPLDCLATPEGRRRLDEYLTRLELGFPV